MEESVKGNDLKVLKYVVLIENYFSLRKEIDFYETNKANFKANKDNAITDKNEDYFINIKKSFTQSDENEFWLSFFVETDPFFYEELLYPFKKDSQRNTIICGLKSAYETMNESFKRDYHLVCKFLMEYWTEPDSKSVGLDRIKWEGERQEFAELVYEESVKSKPTNYAKFVRAIYNKYEFPSDWDWTSAQCLELSYKVKNRVLALTRNKKNKLSIIPEPFWKNLEKTGMTI